MSAIAGTFDEIERTADQAYAYALLVRVGTSYIRCLYRLHALTGAVHRLLNVLTPEKVGALTPEQSTWLTRTLQEIHRVLLMVSKSSEVKTVENIPLLGGKIRIMRDQTEDLEDIIETLVLTANPAFGALVGACASDVRLSDREQHCQDAQLVF